MSDLLASNRKPRVLLLSASACAGHVRAAQALAKPRAARAIVEDALGLIH